MYLGFGSLLLKIPVNVAQTFGFSPIELSFIYVWYAEITDQCRSIVSVKGAENGSNFTLLHQLVT